MSDGSDWTKFNQTLSHAEQPERVAARDHLLLGRVQPGMRERLGEPLRDRFFLDDRPVGSHQHMVGAKQVDRGATVTGLMPMVST